VFYQSPKEDGNSWFSSMTTYFFKHNIYPVLMLKATMGNVFTCELHAKSQPQSAGENCPRHSSSNLV